MASPQRIERLRELIKEETGQILQFEVKDPRLGFVSVTDVELSADLHHAKIYVSVLGNDEQKAQTMEGLRSAVRFVRGEIGRRIKIHHTPEIQFRLDESIERGTRLVKMIEAVRAKDDEAAAGEAKDPARTGEESAPRPETSARKEEPGGDGQGGR
ncbi:MAG: 30S ribosome-binding factor RbfA [Armatimonadetes bacterium]|nr:30S ribosome-binding factor RbfA [Armatimonadota bacterium]